MRQLTIPTYAYDRRHVQSLRETPNSLIRSRFNDHLVEAEAHTAPPIDRRVVSQLGHLAKYTPFFYSD